MGERGGEGPSKDALEKATWWSLGFVLGNYYLVIDMSEEAGVAWVGSKLYFYFYFFW